LCGKLRACGGQECALCFCSMQAAAIGHRDQERAEVVASHVMQSNAAQQTTSIILYQSHTHSQTLRNSSNKTLTTHTQRHLTLFISANRPARNSSQKHRRKTIKNNNSATGVTANCIELFMHQLWCFTRQAGS